LESLLIQVKCIEYLIRINAIVEQDTNNNEILNDLQIISRFLGAERALPVYDRERITYYFGDPCAEPLCWPSKGGDRTPIPDQLSEFIPKDMAFLVTEILARIGFTLYTLRSKRIQGHKRQQENSEEDNAAIEEQEKWLRKFFRFDERWNDIHKDTEKLQIKESDLGRYCETLLQSLSIKKESSDSDTFRDEVERRFALLLRDVGKPNPKDVEELDEEAFYNAILGTATQNIGNLVTIPRINRGILMRHGYRWRREHGDLSKDTVAEGLEHTDGKSKIQNKLVVLRRWQSFNPKIPRPSNRELRGGGYYLLWQKKGIVIDPGYDFIQNFYDEGFSLEDIDAVIVTHSHPDHDNDFANILTLIKEWNEFNEKTGQADRGKKLDLFLNESVLRKFSAFLQAPNMKFGRVIPLPTLYWNKDSDVDAEGPFRGKNVHIDMCRSDYRMSLEVIPAWHDDIIGKTSAVGLKFHLCDEDEHEVGIVGYTGDTGAYGLDMTRESKSEWCIAHKYNDCNVLIAHLGDIRLRELASVMRAKGAPWHTDDNLHPLIKLLRELFKNVQEREFRSKVRDFLYFIITLDLVPSIVLKAPIECQLHMDKSSEVQSWFCEVQSWLGNYIMKNDTVSNDYRFQRGPTDTLENAFNRVKKQINLDQELERQIKSQLNKAESSAVRLSCNTFPEHEAYLLLELLTACTLSSWQYPYHLGIYGTYKLFESMVNHWKGETEGNSIFVVGELPEELASYRHVIARWLNAININVNIQDSGELKKHVHAFTGDIGLHIGLKVVGEKMQPKIRCAYCNYNNETVCKQENYHSPDKILETQIKRLQGAMIYLCTQKDHYPENPDKPRHFLSRPELRLI